MSQPTNRHGAAHIYVTPKYTANDIAGVDHITEYSTVSVSLTPRTVRYEVFRFYADYGYVSKQLFRTTPDSLRLLGPHSHEPHFHAVSDNISLIGVRMHAIWQTYCQTWSSIAHRWRQTIHRHVPDRFRVIPILPRKQTDWGTATGWVRTVICLPPCKPNLPGCYRRTFQPTPQTNTGHGRFVVYTTFPTVVQCWRWPTFSFPNEHKVTWNFIVHMTCHPDCLPSPYWAAPDLTSVQNC